MFPGGAITFFFILHLHLAAAWTLNYTQISCAAASALFAANSTYASNLDTLFSSLSTNLTKSTSGFASSTVGSAASATVYGLALCRGDVSDNECASCFSLAVSNLHQNCSLHKEAVAWQEWCMLRYANRKFLSSMEDDPVLIMNNVNIASGDAWPKVLGPTLNDVITRAASASGGKKFATKEAAYTELDTLYSLAQCTPDLTKDDCTKCLQVAKGNIPVRNYGGIALLPSCTLRFELYPFYNNYSIPDLPIGPAPVSTPAADAGGGTPGNGKGSKSTVVIAAIAVPIAVLALLIAVRFCIKRRRANKKLQLPVSETAVYYFPLTILTTLLLCRLVASDGMITVCPPSNHTQNQTSKSYRNNLQNLMTNFALSASTLSFDNSSVGESPDKVYGLYVCRGDATSELCHSCVTNLTTWISTEAESACKEGFGYMDSCMLHYANYSFIGKADNELLAVSVSAVNATNVGEFNRTLIGMVGGLIDDAAFKSEGFFSTREATVGGDDGTVYGLAQCTPDIGRVNCSACLKRASRSVGRCCGELSVWFMLSNCQLRYSNSTFYEVGVGNPPANSNAQPPVLASSSITLDCSLLLYFAALNMARQLRAIDVKHFSIAISFSLLCKLAASDSSMFSACMSDYNQTINNRTGQVDDKYQDSLHTVLNNLISTSTSTSLNFYNATAGKSPYKSYAIYLCRGDTKSKLCSSCVTNLTEWAISNTDNCTESLAFSDHCMLHYANYSFFGTADNRPVGYSYSKIDTKNYLVYNRTLASVAENVIREAAYVSANLFATSEAAVGEDENVYVLAQCTPDISRGSCSGCLKAAQSHLQHDIPGGAKFSLAMLSSCQLRYDNESFFGGSPASHPPISAVLAATLSLFFVICPATNHTRNQTTELDANKTNLQDLLTNFTVNASTLSFHTSSAGESPDKVYGLYVCRGDATPKLCQSCLTNLTAWIFNDTESICKDGFGYMDRCMLQYDKYSFFGKSESRLLAYTYNWVNATNVGGFNRTLTGMIRELIHEAAFESEGLFATREADVGGGDGTVYGLAQCTPDIGRGNCSACLKIASSEIEKCCRDKMIAWFMLSNCQLRYSNVSFYEVEVDQVEVEHRNPPAHNSNGAQLAMTPRYARNLPLMRQQHNQLGFFTTVCFATQTTTSWKGQRHKSRINMYNRTLEGAVEQVTREAAFNCTNLFATYEAAVDEHEKVYAGYQ
ncbi:LOW QUALITY PROTEIN: hypothetical protein V2J09_019325 [Rumex salicifolius]